MSDVSSLVRGLPDGTAATLRGTELTIGDMCVDLRTLLHECGAVDQIKAHTFPANHAQYPRWTVALGTTRNGTYTGVLRRSNGYCYTAMDGKVPLSDHPSAGDAAVARAVYLNRKRGRVHDDVPKKQTARSKLEEHDRQVQELTKETGTTLPRAPSAASSSSAEEDDVLFVKERTREERDAEGRANAVVVEM